MDQQTRHPNPTHPRALSRRSLLAHTATVASGTLLAGILDAGGVRHADAAAPDTRLPAAHGADPRPRAAIEGIFAAMERHPLVALAGSAGLQELHDLLTAILFHPALPARLTDIVIEFGNARYQDLADRFVLDDQPVDRTELAQIWRQIGDPLWNAPIYEQFFRTVRAANWMRPHDRHIRVLLGSVPLDPTHVSMAQKNAVLQLASQFDAHYADVVERLVLQRGRRALLLGGAGHLLRGLHADEQPHQLNAASLLARRHPGALYVVDTLVLPPGPQPDPVGQRLQTTLAQWPRPALAPLAGTWLGATTRALDGYWINGLADRALSATAARYDAQADAVLYLGPGEALTLSQADPAIYHWGAYPAMLRHLSRFEAQLEGQPVDLVAQGVRLATAGPNWFAQFNR